jgi:two-component system response regulator HydG
MIGAAASFQRSLRLAEQAAASDATVLVHGESGTGKELVARYIHARSARHDKPFVALHCAALPESIIESELFGHEPGAFTGATRRKPGRLETADAGTLFLDEVGELPPSVQVKLLRVLQEGEVQRLGSNSTIRIDVRIVAATHRDLALMVREGQFREDLFYRLHVIPVTLPPLRERTEDIELLAQHFVTHYAMSNGRTPPVLSPAVRRSLVAWHWPGNVRELQNVIERAVVLDADGVIDLDDLPAQIGPAASSSPTLTVAVGTPLADVERRLILATLEHTGGDKALAASLGRRLIRLQCYEGLDAASAVYEWTFPAQMIEIRLAEAGGDRDRASLASELFSERFLTRRPLLEAMSAQEGGAPVLLIASNSARLPETEMWKPKRVLAAGSAGVSSGCSVQSPPST